MYQKFDEKPHPLPLSKLAATVYTEVLEFAFTAFLSPLTPLKYGGFRGI